MKNEKTNVIQGYKAFVLKDDKLTDRYGNTYELEKQYHVDGDIKFKKNGYHLCINPEDTLRYVDAFNDNVVITSVLGSGNLNRYDDDYYEYDDMYAVSDMKILKMYTKEELLENQAKASRNIKRFIDGYNLNLNDLYYILDNYRGIENDLRRYMMLYLINHKVYEFNAFINKINITDDEVATILKYLPFANISDSDKNYIRYSLGEALKKDKVRVRK